MIDIDELRRLVEVEKLQQWRVAELLGCSRSCVERNCQRHGIKTQRTGPRGGSLHPDWKGGRKLVGAYWYIWTDVHPMRTKQNYVAEHRLVVEETLGRFLERHEVVHHINGDPKDNRPENLIVFQSNADHLRAELTGKVPNWTPEGRERTLQAVRQMHKSRKVLKSGDLERTQTNGLTQAIT